jgi:hypothetical protein
VITHFYMVPCQLLTRQLLTRLWPLTTAHTTTAHQAKYLSLRQLPTVVLHTADNCSPPHSTLHLHTPDRTTAHLSASIAHTTIAHRQLLTRQLLTRQLLTWQLPTDNCPHDDCSHDNCSHDRRLVSINFKYSLNPLLTTRFLIRIARRLLTHQEAGFDQL